MRRSIFGVILFVMASLVAFGQATSPNDAPQDSKKDLRQDVQQTQKDKQQVSRDTKQTQRDQAALRKDIRNGNKAAASKETKDLHQLREVFVLALAGKNLVADDEQTEVHAVTPSVSGFGSGGGTPVGVATMAIASVVRKSRNAASR